MLPLHHARHSNSCNTFSCGEDVKEIGYPFWGGDRPKTCGLQAFNLECDKDNKTLLRIGGSNTKLRVLHIHTSSLEIELKRIDSCPTGDTINATFDKTYFEYGESTEDLHMFLDCPLDLQMPPPLGSVIRTNLSCGKGGEVGYNGFFGSEGLQGQFPSLGKCLVKVRVPVSRRGVEEFVKSGKLELRELLNPSFVMLYKDIELACLDCENSGGVCVSKSSDQLACRCPKGDVLHPCPNGTSLFLHSFSFYTSEPSLFV